MKVHHLIAFLAIMLWGVAYGADVKYEATFTGVTWAGCKTLVSSAIKKLDGVKTVEIKAGKAPKTQSIIVMGEKGGITKAQVVKALGSKSSRFVCKDWKEQKQNR